MRDDQDSRMLESSEDTNKLLMEILDVLLRIEHAITADQVQEEQP